jgi:hypothetical protein
LLLFSDFETKPKNNQFFMDLIICDLNIPVFLGILNI